MSQAARPVATGVKRKFIARTCRTKCEYCSCAHIKCTKASDVHRCDACLQYNVECKGRVELSSQAKSAKTSHKPSPTQRPDAGEQDEPPQTLSTVDGEALRHASTAPIMHQPVPALIPSLAEGEGLLDAIAAAQTSTVLPTSAALISQPPSNASPTLARAHNTLKRKMTPKPPTPELPSTMRLPQRPSWSPISPIGAAFRAFNDILVGLQRDQPLPDVEPVLSATKTFDHVPTPAEPPPQPLRQESLSERQNQAPFPQQQPPPSADTTPSELSSSAAPGSHPLEQVSPTQIQQQLPLISRTTSVATQTAAPSTQSSAEVIPTELQQLSRASNINPLSQKTIIGQLRDQFDPVLIELYREVEQCLSQFGEARNSAWAKDLEQMLSIMKPWRPGGPLRPSAWADIAAFYGSALGKGSVDFTDAHIWYMTPHEFQNYLTLDVKIYPCIIIRESSTYNPSANRENIRRFLEVLLMKFGNGSVEIQDVEGDTKQPKFVATEEYVDRITKSQREPRKALNKDEPPMNLLNLKAKMVDDYDVFAPIIRRDRFRFDLLDTLCQRAESALKEQQRAALAPSSKSSKSKKRPKSKPVPETNAGKARAKAEFYGKSIDLQSCLIFGLFAQRGSFSGWHVDVLNGTYVKCVAGLKAWFIHEYPLTEDEKASFAEAGPMWRPNPDRVKLVLLQPGDTLYMPAGEVIPHAPVTVLDALMRGGMCWDTLRIRDILSNIAWIVANNEVTNEPIPQQLIVCWQELEKLIEAKPQMVELQQTTAASAAGGVVAAATEAYASPPESHDSAGGNEDDGKGGAAAGKQQQLVDEQMEEEIRLRVAQQLDVETDPGMDIHTAKTTLSLRDYFDFVSKIVKKSMQCDCSGKCATGKCPCKTNLASDYKCTAWCHHTNERRNPALCL